MYKWNLQELKLKRLIAYLKRKPYYYEHFTSIINQIDLSKRQHSPEDILLVSKDQELNYEYILSRFKSGLEIISDEIYQTLIDIYFMIGAYAKYDDNPEFSKMYLTDDELIDIVGQMIASIGIKEYEKIYQKIKSKIYHYLNFQHNIEAHTTANIQGIAGITLNDPFTRKSYINVFRTDTIVDIEVLFHETMHAIYYYLLRDEKLNGIPIFHELEGQIGSLYTYEYLRTIGLKKESKMLYKDFIDNLLLSTHLLVLNHALHVTAENNHFNKNEAEELINSQLIGKRISISDEEIPKITAYLGYENITTTLAALLALEIMSKNLDIYSKFNLLHEIKKHDSEDIENTLNTWNVDYRSENFKTLRKAYEETH